ASAAVPNEDRRTHRGHLVPHDGKHALELVDGARRPGAVRPEFLDGGRVPQIALLHGAVRANQMTDSGYELLHETVEPEWRGQARHGRGALARRGNVQRERSAHGLARDRDHLAGG